MSHPIRLPGLSALVVMIALGLPLRPAVAAPDAPFPAPPVAIPVAVDRTELDTAVRADLRHVRLDDRIDPRAAEQLRLGRHVMAIRMLR